MTGSMTIIAMATVWALPCRASDTAPTELTAALLQVVPAKMPAVIVVEHPQRFDRTIASWLTRLDPDSLGWGLFEELRGDLPIGEWIDLTRPMAIAFGGAGKRQPPILWAQVPGFDEHMGGLARAVREGDTWRIALPDGQELYARRCGDYVVAAMSMASLEQATQPGPALADVLPDRRTHTTSRHVIVHLNMARLHEAAAELVAELAALGPLLALLVEQELGSGTAGPAALAEAWLAETGALLDQAESVDLFVGMDEQSVSVNCMAHFNEGSVRRYLLEGKSDPRPFFPGIEARPYVLAMAARVPGRDVSPALPPVVERTLARLLEKIAGPPSVAPGVSSERAAAAADTLRTLAVNIEGAEGVLSWASDGVRLQADLWGPDPQAIGKDITALLTGENPALRKLRGGPALEPLGSRTVGETVIEEFALKPVPPANVEGGRGEIIRWGMGVAGTRLLLCLGSEIDVNGRFGLTVSRPFAQADYPREALAALPSDANVVVLIDPARLMPWVSRLQGKQPADMLPPGPPIAISCTLVGNPARIDIHIPLRALERLRQAMQPSGKL